jgi:hypothetical protein
MKKTLTQYPNIENDIIWEKKIALEKEREMEREMARARFRRI